ncbi:unnamed protein product [Cuscuta campestris]|uniref:Transposase-associated domain-containing protein n=1 Tax=Cuscuta campestris TaxID=132261 RepID=A0A484KZZ4_9ASTE|nr:unnamed protein product [Cuscuta campestris]
MYKKYEREGVVSQEWVDNVVEFVEYCESSPNVDRLDNKKMRCPCKKCKNIKFCSSKIMLEHILRFGFTPNYFDWVCHGENHGDYVPPQQCKVPRQADASDVSHVPGREQFVHMIYDAVGPTRINSVLEEEPNSTDKHFFEMLKAADTDLWPGSSKMSKLSAVARLLNIKLEHNLSERCYDTICQYIKDILPEDNSMVNDFYETKKMIEEISQVYVRLCANEIKESTSQISEESLLKRVEETFANWFQKHVENDRSVPEIITDVAKGPLSFAKSYPIYFVNGYCFHTVKHGSKRAVYNSGVSITGEYGEYFGVLEEILEIEYPALPLKHCVLFKCRWFDPRLNRGTRIYKKYGLLEVLKKGEFNRYEPFIFGSQANQVVYVEYPCTQKTKSDWIAVCHVHPRGNWIESGNTLESVDKVQQEPFQANGMTERTTIMEVTQEDEHINLSREGDANFADDDSNAEDEASRVGESIEDQEDGVGDDHDFEDCFGEGRSGGARDGEDGVHDNVDQQGGYHEGPGHHGQFVVTITRAGAALITPAFYERTDATGFSWGKVSKTTKEFYFREFKGMLRKAFLKKAAERYASYTYNQRNPTRLKKKKMDPRPLEQLKKVWEEDPEFLELSKTKKKNRRKGKEDGPSWNTGLRLCRTKPCLFYDRF